MPSITSALPSFAPLPSIPSTPSHVPPMPSITSALPSFAPVPVSLPTSLPVTPSFVPSYVPPYVPSVVPPVPPMPMPSVASLPVPPQPPPSPPPPASPSPPPSASPSPPPSASPSPPPSASPSPPPSASPSPPPSASPSPPPSASPSPPPSASPSPPPSASPSPPPSASPSPPPSLPPSPQPSPPPPQPSLPPLPKQPPLPREPPLPKEPPLPNAPPLPEAPPLPKAPPPAPIKVVPLRGTARVVGNLQGCTVFADYNGNGELDEGEPTAKDKTGESGTFLVEVEEDKAESMPLVVARAETCVDVLTGVPLRASLFTPPQCRGGFITPPTDSLHRSAGSSSVFPFDPCVYDVVRETKAFISSGQAGRRRLQAVAEDEVYSGLYAYWIATLSPSLIGSAISDIAGPCDDPPADFPTADGAVQDAVGAGITAAGGSEPYWTPPDTGKVFDRTAGVGSLVDAATSATGTTLGETIEECLAEDGE
ncbi:hypothetical protein EMIHUDRAFT_366884, partial [Emiliania huxleyi CCMP1516]|uniref:Uncharacterized protein n=2 Tax=Emiliania huxleyi TaxID=2903 RepID=A0A0D3JTG5_EMIH1